MTLEKRIPMAGNMEKVASEDLIDKTSDLETVEGNGWSINIHSSIVESIGEETVKRLISGAVDMMADLAERNRKGIDSHSE